MATIKSFTSLEQSKKLAKILPLESEDMYYWCADHYPKEDWIIEVGSLDDNYECICAWSLAALLDVLPYPYIEQNYKGKWTCRVELGNTTYLWEDSNPIDACVVMVEKLHELNLL